MQNKSEFAFVKTHSSFVSFEKKVDTKMQVKLAFNIDGFLSNSVAKIGKKSEKPILLLISFS